MRLSHSSEKKIKKKTLNTNFHMLFLQESSKVCLVFIAFQGVLGINGFL